MDSPRSATSQAFSTPELLEQILNYLLDDLVTPTNREDARSKTIINNSGVLTHLLHCSQVGPAWYHCLFYGSKPFQRALFLLRSSEGERSWQRRGLYGSQQGYYRGLAYTAPVLNPIVQTAFADCHLRYWRSGLGAEGPHYHAYMVFKRRHLEEARNRLQQGYGKAIMSMYLAQPPPTEMVAEIWSRDYLKDFSKRTTGLRDPHIYHADGVTIGLVLEKLGPYFDEYDDVTEIKVTTVGAGPVESGLDGVTDIKVALVQPEQL